MSIRNVLFCSLLCCLQVQGSLYQYPEDKRPAVSLKEACTISETMLAKLGLRNDYYVFHVAIYGDEDQSGAGAWNLMYRNTQGDKVQISIYLTEDLCLVMMLPKSGKSTENGYTRDGNISPKWLEWQKKLRDQEANDPFGPPAKKTK